MNIRPIDVKRYLQDNRINFVTEGKNVSSTDWIGVSCPFCPEPDPSNHLGINLTTGNISCWRCNTRGAFIKYVIETQHCLYPVAVSILQPYTSRELKSINEENHIIRGNLIVPKIIDLTNIHREYLINRRFNPDELIAEYKIASFPPTNLRFGNRIFIPIYLHKTMVCYTGRTSGDWKEVSKYKNCPNENALVNAKNCTYNLDTVEDTAIVVEGPTDVWRIGKGCVALLGKKYTTEQVLMLSKLKRLFIIFDRDADEEAHKLAYSLTNFIRDIYVYTLGTKDPAELDEKDVKILRKEIFSKIY